MNAYTTHPSYVLGFHSCDKEVGLKVLNGKDSLKPSINKWDWLGHGVYFWEHNPLRALQYAKEVATGEQKAKAKINVPFVIGLGHCLNLTEPSNYPLVKGAYNSLQQTLKNERLELPKNTGDSRILDCAVFMHLHNLSEQNGSKPYDTVRGAFPEGNPIYEGCAMNDQTHIQICVRNPNAILGYFLPFPIDKVNPNL